MARITKKDVIAFTIKNLVLRIEGAGNTLYSHEFYLNRQTSENVIRKLSREINYLKATIGSYKNAKTKLYNNTKLNEEDVQYILKSLNIRSNQLNKNLDDCRVVIAREKQVLKSKKDRVDSMGGIGVATKFDEKASKHAIEHCEERIAKITNSMALCNKAIDIFSKM